MAPLVAGDGVEGIRADGVLLDLGQAVVELHGVALELEVGQAVLQLGRVGGGRSSHPSIVSAAAPA